MHFAKPQPRGAKTAVICAEAVQKFAQTLQAMRRANSLQNVSQGLLQKLLFEYICNNASFFEQFAKSPPRCAKTAVICAEVVQKFAQTLTCKFFAKRGARHCAKLPCAISLKHASVCLKTHKNAPRCAKKPPRGGKTNNKNTIEFSICSTKQQNKTTFFGEKL